MLCDFGGGKCCRARQARAEGVLFCNVVSVLTSHCIRWSDVVDGICAVLREQAALYYTATEVWEQVEVYAVGCVPCRLCTRFGEF